MVPPKQIAAHLFQPGVCPNPYGRGAPAARAKLDEVERQAEAAKLLADLGREPSATEAIAIETLSAQVVRARRMRADGRHSEAEMAERLITRNLGKIGVRQGPAKPVGPTLAEIRARYGAPPIAQNGDEASEGDADEKRTCDAADGRGAP